MTIVVNGRDQQVESGLTVAELLEQLGLDPDGVALAVEREVVPRSRHHQTVLEEGATIEVIRAVGGG